MPLNKTRLALALLGGGVVLLGLLALLVGWRLLQASPAYQFMQARRRWETRPFNHYRLAFDHGFTRAVTLSAIMTWKCGTSGSSTSSARPV